MAITQTLLDASGQRVYPKTIASSVNFNGNKTVDSALKTAVYTSTGTPTSLSDPIDATTLNGHNSSFFATNSDLSLMKKELLTELSGTPTVVSTDEIDEHDANPDAHVSMFKSKTVYVNGSIGSDTNTGDESAPFKTIQGAINNTPMAAKSIVIMVSPGTYTEDILLQYRPSNIIAIKALNDAEGVNISGSLTIDSCNTVGLSKLNFLNPTQKTDSIYYSLIAYHSKVNISGCTFDSSDIDGQSLAIYSSDTDIIVYDTSISNYTWGISAYSGYVKCYNIISTNNGIVFNSDDSIVMYDAASKLNYSSQLLVSSRSGLVINESAAQYLNMFSNANANDAAPFHNSIYRGKDITNYLNDGSLFTRISSGTFDDLFIGDYFTMDIAVDGYEVKCNKYVLCGFDTYMNTGDNNQKLTKHHAVVMPAGRLFTAAMNDTDTTEGGYAGSKMHQEIMPKIATGIKTIIGDSHLITYRDLLVNTIVNNKSHSWEWYDTTCRICSEIDVFGITAWGNGYDVGLGNHQLPIFKLYPNFYQGENKYWMWLSSVAGATFFSAYSGGDGCIFWCGASDSTGGVCPRFLIG